MSYVEHGPRIFLASKHNSGSPLMYGDYVLPKKRLEGRLKLHDSCSDIRAWSPNSLENSRYFRELNEHDSSMGKIIPFNVIIDNIIQLNPKSQNELQIVKKELKKYKTLKLTTKQEEQLQNLDNISKIKELPQKNNYTTGVLKGAFFNISKSSPIIQSNLLSIHKPCKRNSQSNTRNVSAITNQYNQLYSYSLTMFDPSLKNYNLIPSCRSTVRSLPSADYNKNTASWIEYIDVAVQVNTETHDIEIQIDDEVDKYLNKIITISAMSQTSFTSKFSNEDNSADLDKNSSHTNNHKEQSFECDASCSNSSQDIESLTEFDTEMGTESDFDLHNSVHKGIIIQKDSEIIVLKNELCVRDAELEELHDMNKHLEVLLKEKESCIYTQQGNLKAISWSKRIWFTIIFPVSLRSHLFIYTHIHSLRRTILFYSITYLLSIIYLIINYYYMSIFCYLLHKFLLTSSLFSFFLSQFPHQVNNPIFSSFVGYLAYTKLAF
ncbi:uncharacterized protein isoform X2 [Bombus fervidus]|uniref:uncharacterized protein isoform X2 n=1 Tax=Bombus fervidus TaxID=203811 RepID=UPI003AB8A528